MASEFDDLCHPRAAVIDGLGLINTGPDLTDWNTPWPSGLPSDWYWTGTEHSDIRASSWLIRDFDGGWGFVRIDSYPHHMGIGNIRVVCVP